MRVTLCAIPILVKTIPIRAISSRGALARAEPQPSTDTRYEIAATALERALRFTTKWVCGVDGHFLSGHLIENQ